MNRRNFVISSALLAAIAFAPTACKKEGGGGASGASGDMLSFLPKASQGVVGVSWAKARSSALFKSYEDKLLKEMPEEIEKIKTECGIDLLADINTIVIAANSSEKDAIVAIKGDFDQKKVEECVTKMDGTVKDGAYTIDGDVTNAYWPSKDTLLISEGLSSEKIKAAAADGSVKDNKELMSLIGKVDTSATIWAAGNVPAEAGGAMGMMGGTPPKSAYLSLVIDSGIAAKVGMVFEKAEDATNLNTQMAMMLGMAKGQAEFKEMLEGVSSKVDGKTIIMKAKLSGDQLKKLEGMAGDMGM